MCTFKTRKEVLNNNDLFLQKMQGIKGFIHKICSVWRGGGGGQPDGDEGVTMGGGGGRPNRDVTVGS